jgi:hypothetical protein
MDSPESQVADPIFDKFGEESEDPSSRNNSGTPSSEISPPESPPKTTALLDKAVDGRVRVRRLAASLSLEEQVSATGAVATVCVLTPVRSHFL